MAEVLDSFEFGMERSIWGEWLDGRIWRLERGHDFDVIPDTLDKRARAAAKRRGLKVRVRVRGDVVVIQAYQPDGVA